MPASPPPAMSRPAFEQSLAATWPVVVHRVRARFGDAQLAEEVSLDCLSRAFELWRTDPGYFTARDLTAWATRRAAWRALDRLRDRGRHRPLPEERAEDGDEGAPLRWAPRVAARPDEAARDCQLAWAALGRLPAEDREILLAWYYDQRSDQEIGAALYGAATGTAQARGLRVWRRRRRAQGRLREALLAEGVEPADWGGGLAV